MRTVRLEAPDFETACVYLSYIAGRAELSQDLIAQLALGDQRIVLRTNSGMISYNREESWILVEGEPEWVALILEDETAC